MTVGLCGEGALRGCERGAAGPGGAYGVYKGIARPRAGPLRGPPFLVAACAPQGGAPGHLGQLVRAYCHGASALMVRCGEVL